MTKEFTNTVIKAIGPGSAPRTRKILTSLVQHVHDFARENSITLDEWAVAMDFINRIGKRTDETRDEAILVSDVLGLEALVDSQTNQSGARNQTSSSIIGPFYRKNSPTYSNGESIIQKDVGGEKTLVTGRITNIDDKPIGGAKIEVWQCAPNGLYEQQDPNQPNFNLRGTFYTDPAGYYSLICLCPTSYPIPTDGPAGELLRMMDHHPMRPSHIHYKVSCPKFHTLITQVYDSRDDYIYDDPVFSVKPDCVVDFVPAKKELSEKGISYELNYNIVLATEYAVQNSISNKFRKNNSLKSWL